MTQLFDQTTINGMVLRNRIVRSATWEGMCNADGRPTPKLTAFYRNLARGEVGLIITGYTFVRPDGKQLPGKMGIHTDAFADDMRSLTAAVHAEGGKICIQLVHAGGQTDSRTAGRQPLAPSSLKLAQYPELPEEISIEDIQDIIKAFGEGARRAKEWGFDAVQIHGAHGYLVNQFLSPLNNQRRDAYGGGIENRCRFLMEVYDSIRAAVGKNFPVLIKLNGSDNLEGGLEIDDALIAAKKLDQAGIDAIEVSGGTPASGDLSAARVKITKPEKEAYNRELGVLIKKAVSCPIMLVGGLRSLEIAEKTLNENELDYIAMARPLIREPALARRWREGDTRPARCISCSSCFIPGLKEGGIYCVVERKEQDKKLKHE